MRPWLALILIVLLCGCAASEDAPEGEAPKEEEVVADTEERAPSALAELPLQQLNAANQDALRIAPLNEDFEQAIYHLMRLAVDSRDVESRRMEMIMILGDAERSLNEMMRLSRGLADAYRILGEECKRRHDAEARAYGEDIDESTLRSLRGRYQQMADAFAAMAELQNGQTRMYLSRFHDASGMRQGLEHTPTPR